MSKYLVTGFLYETVEGSYQRVIEASSRSEALGIAEEGDFNEWTQVGGEEPTGETQFIVGANPTKLTNADDKILKEITNE
jgi:hypothetical protein